jgi:magnesium-transporting ATPase (P-type)
VQQPQTQDKAAPTQPDVLTKGPSSEEASQRLHDYGPNEPAQTSRASLLVEIAQLLANPLVLILLAAI